MERQEKIQTIVLCLQSFCGIIVIIIALPKRSTTPCGLPVDSTTSTCTVINEQMGESLQQIIPKTIQSFDIAYFGNTRTIRLIGSFPIGFGFDVTILTIIVNAVILNHFTIILAKPFASFRVGKVKKQPVATLWFVQHPFVMLNRPLRSNNYSFGFKPHHKLGTVTVYGVGDRTKSAAKACAINGPVTRSVSPVATMLVITSVLMPTSVEPEHVRANIESIIAVYHSNSILLR